MKQFTYKIVTAQPYITISRGAEVELLNKEGSEGWELVGITQNEFQLTYFFKREVPRDMGPPCPG